ncbi:MAG: diaminopimelate dehydrogenase [Clostridia bacterium]
MIRFAVVGYGNIGRACEKIAVESQDFEMVGVFTRRDPSTMKSPYGTMFFRQDDLEKFEDKIDVLALCTGSASDLTELGKRAAEHFNTVDTFDTHAKMRAYADDMQSIATTNGHLSFIGMGWDPGLFSLMRCLFAGVLDNGETATFWGKGVSQGHSEAIRKIDGVENGIQYTIPKEEALKRARSGDIASLTTRDKHLRECFVVCKEGANKAEIERKIVTMPNYFEGYDTVVHFIDKDEFLRDHTAMPHGGFVLRSGQTDGNSNSLEFALKLQSNPSFTAHVLMAYASANAKMHQAGERGAKTILDVPASALIKGDWLDTVGKFV